MMIVPEFIRFYNAYTVKGVLNEYAKTFFGLVNSMFQLQASESLMRVQEASVPHMKESDARGFINDLRKGQRGIAGIVNEARNIKP